MGLLAAAGAMLQAKFKEDSETTAPMLQGRSSYQALSTLEK